MNETRTSLIAADAALVLVDAVAGVQVVTEKVWDYCTEYGQPRGIVINWMDRELANFERALDSVQEVFGRGVVPVQLPIGAEKQFRGVVDLVTMKAQIYTPDGDGSGKIEEIPADMAAAAKEAHEKLVEMVAEGDDALMEEFFAEGTLPVEDLTKGLRLAFREQRHLPGDDEFGAAQYRQRRAAESDGGCFSRSPGAGEGQRLQRGGREGPSGGAARSRDSEHLSIFVFKTLSDPFAGRISYFKVMSGVLKNDASADQLQSRCGGALSAPARDAGKDRRWRSPNCMPET